MKRGPVALAVQAANVSGSYFNSRVGPRVLDSVGRVPREVGSGVGTTGVWLENRSSSAAQLCRSPRPDPKE